MESARLTKTKAEIKTLTGGKRERATKLLAKAEFMERELGKLQEIIEEKGWTEVYKNGANQMGIKKSTEGDVYNTLIKNYSSIMKQLEDMLPKNDDSTGDELLDFLSGK